MILFSSQYSVLTLLKTSENLIFLRPDTHTYVCVSGGKSVFLMFSGGSKGNIGKKKALIAATADILFFSLYPFDLPENIRKPLEWKGLTSSTCNRGSLMLWCNAIKPIQNQNSGRTLILVSSISIYKILEMT